MKKQSRILKKGSNSATVSQPKTAHRASARHSGLCIVDRSVGETVCKIPLIGDELSSVVIASFRQHTTVDQFIADAINEKLGRLPGKPIPDETGHRNPASVPVTFRVQTKNDEFVPEEVVELKLDPDESECVKRAAATTRLSLEELLHFIVLRQMESFNSESECYSVYGNAQAEVDSMLRKCQKHGNAIESLAESILEDLEPSEPKSVSRDNLRAWGGLIFDLACRINRDLKDGSYHWECHVVPALAERKSAPGATAPLPTTERRAA